MYTLTYEQITRDFHVSTVVATLGLSLFVMGYVRFPKVDPIPSESSKSDSKMCLVSALDQW